MLLQGWSSQTPTLGWEAKPRVPARLLMEQANPMAGLSTPEPGTGSDRPGAEREAQQGLKGHFHLTVVECQAFLGLLHHRADSSRSHKEHPPQSSLSLGSRAPPSFLLTKGCQKLRQALEGREGVTRRLLEQRLSTAELSTGNSTSSPQYGAL